MHDLDVLVPKGQASHDAGEHYLVFSGSCRWSIGSRAVSAESAWTRGAGKAKIPVALFVAGNALCGAVT